MDAVNAVREDGGSVGEVVVWATVVVTAARVVVVDAAISAGGSALTNT